MIESSLRTSIQSYKYDGSVLLWQLFGTWNPASLTAQVPADKTDKDHTLESLRQSLPDC